MGSVGDASRKVGGMYKMGFGIFFGIALDLKKQHCQGLYF